MKRVALALSVVLLVVGLGARSAGAGLDTIAAYTGTWHTTTVHVTTPYSKAGHESAVLHNDCWRSADFYACHQFVNGASVALIVFTYNTKNRVYTTYPIPVDGSAAGSGTLTIKGNVWTYPWKDVEKAKTVYFRVLNTFSTPTTIEYRQEYSLDGKHWVAMATGHEVKVR